MWLVRYRNAVMDVLKLLGKILKILLKYPLLLLGAIVWFLVNDVGNMVCSLYKKLVPNYVPHYRRIERCRQAAMSGDTRAQLTMGYAYEHSDYGLPQDYAEAVKWYRKAAEQNNGKAQLNLGVRLAEGKGVEKNLVEGLMWLYLSRHMLARQAAGWFLRDASIQAISRVKAQMTEEQIAEAWGMVDSSPL
jgi:TPR repeat protein